MMSNISKGLLTLAAVNAITALYIMNVYPDKWYYVIGCAFLQAPLGLGILLSIEHDTEKAKQKRKQHGKKV
jgi:hypothetical protein